MKKTNPQLLNTLLITIGGGLTLFAIASDGDNKYFKIVGIVILMLGLYRATNHFIGSEEERKDSKDEENEI